jgi:hypothetical protein
MSRSLMWLLRVPGRRAPSFRRQRLSPLWNPLASSCGGLEKTVDHFWSTGPRNNCIQCLSTHLKAFFPAAVQRQRGFTAHPKVPVVHFFLPHVGARALHGVVMHQQVQTCVALLTLTGQSKRHSKVFFPSAIQRQSVFNVSKILGSLSCFHV